MEASGSEIASLFDLPQDILPLILNFLPLHQFTQCRQVCTTFKKRIATIAAVETIPSLLLSENYENLFNLYQDAHMMGTITASAGYAAKMKDAVWKSPLVQWLISRGELDLIPWREIMFLRVAKQQRGLSCEADNFSTGAERDSTSPVMKILLPSKNRVEFNLHTWKDHIMWFENTRRTSQTAWDRSWEKLIADAKVLKAGGSVTFPPEDEDDDEYTQTEIETIDKWALDIDRWIHDSALGVLTPEECTKTHAVHLNYAYNNSEYVPGIFHGDWMIYPLQLANVIAVLFYFHED
eukprot:TRINITY_DN12565_c0_g1_i1.p1 TRINITY_DN12565_c0_g1~~TRINITY_DN12565_c0_g1_i1.p1  ORF type:complete len:294 (-),score=42.46 TRINITY_DN12565_c0_g1_i1:36-917(-)